MSKIVSKPATEAYRDGWERAFRGDAIRRAADALVAAASDGVITNEATIALGVARKDTTALVEELKGRGWLLHPYMDAMVTREWYAAQHFPERA